MKRARQHTVGNRVVKKAKAAKLQKKPKVYAVARSTGVGHKEKPIHHHSVAKDYAKALLDPKNGPLVGVPVEPRVKTTKHRTEALTTFQIEPNVSLTGMAGTIRGCQDVPNATVARSADVAFIEVRDAIIDGLGFASIMQPSKYAEAICTAGYAILGGGAEGGPGSVNPGWVTLSGAAPGKACWFNPRGFGKHQAAVAAAAATFGPFPVSIQEVPFGATIDMWLFNGGASSLSSIVATDCLRNLPMWQKTSVTSLKSGLKIPSGFDPARYMVSDVAPDGTFLPKPYVCKITGRPTSERWTTIGVQHLGALIPAEWTTAFSDIIGVGTNVFGQAHIGLTPMLALAMRNTGTDITWFNATLNACANQPSPYGALQNFTTNSVNPNQLFTYIRSNAGNPPIGRYVAGKATVYTMQNSVNIQGDVTAVHLAGHPDIAVYSAKDLYEENELRKSSLSSCTAQKPATVLYAPQTPEEYSFFPTTQFGFGSKILMGFLITGATGGSLNIPSVSSTPVKVPLQFEFNGLVEVFNTEDGQVVPASLLQAQTIADLTTAQTSANPKAGLPDYGTGAAVTHTTGSSPSTANAIAGAASQSQGLDTQPGGNKPSFANSAPAVFDPSRRAITPKISGSPMQMEEQTYTVAPFTNIISRTTPTLIRPVPTTSNTSVVPMDWSRVRGVVRSNPAPWTGVAFQPPAKKANTTSDALVVSAPKKHESGWSKVRRGLSKFAHGIEKGIDVVTSPVRSILHSGAAKSIESLASMDPDPRVQGALRAVQMGRTAADYIHEQGGARNVGRQFVDAGIADAQDYATRKLVDAYKRNLEKRQRESQSVIPFAVKKPRLGKAYTAPGGYSVEEVE